jgi:hypothetical protein
MNTDATEMVIRGICLPALQAEIDSLTDEPAASFVEFAWCDHRYRCAAIESAVIGWTDAAEVLGVSAQGQPSDDLIARVAIDALTLGDARVFVHRDEPAHFDVLGALLELECSPAVKADMLDCIEAVLDDLDRQDAIDWAIHIGSCAWVPAWQPAWAS